MLFRSATKNITHKYNWGGDSFTVDYSDLNVTVSSRGVKSSRLVTFHSPANVSFDLDFPEGGGPTTTLGPAGRTLGDIGTGLGDMFIGMSPGLLVLLIVLVIATFVGVVLFALKKRVG